MGYGFSTVGHVVPPGDAHTHAPPLRAVLSDPISELAGYTPTLEDLMTYVAISVATLAWLVFGTALLVAAVEQLTK